MLSQLETLQMECLETCPGLQYNRIIAFTTVLESVVLLAAQSDQRKFGSSERYFEK